MAVQYRRHTKKKNNNLPPVFCLVVGIILIVSFLSEYAIYITFSGLALLIIYAIITGFKKSAEDTPKASPMQVSQAENLMKQLLECTALINSTASSRIFFARLHFSLDVLLELQKFEKYNIFTGSTPTEDYQKLINNLEATVDAFIDRSIIDHVKKHEHLKTQKAKDRNMYKHLSSLLLDFEEADTYWSGNNMYPHYTGPLYTDSNYQRIKEMYDDYFRKVELEKPE